MNRTNLRWIAFASIALLTLAARTQADEFFNIVANGSGGTVVASSGRNIVNLTDNLISLNSGFVQLVGQNVTASLSWGGVPHAIVFTENAAQTQATISFLSTGFTQAFFGTSAANLQDQIHDFIKGDGEKAYANFLNQMNQLSAVATLDGNPQAATAFIADAVFERFGIANQQPTESRQFSDGAYFALSGEGGQSRAEGLNGTWADMNLDSGIRFGSHVALSFGTTLAYREIADSESYDIAEEVALPVTIINNHDNGLSWQIAPWGFAGLSASYDQAAGGILVGGGGTSSLALHLGTFTLTLGDQIDYNGNVNIKVDGYQFDTVINQWILKNGLDASFRFPGTPFFIDGGAYYSNFLHHAAITDYWTPIAGAGVKFGPGSYLRAAFRGDYARGYNSTGGELDLVLTY